MKTNATIFTISILISIAMMLSSTQSYAISNTPIGKKIEVLIAENASSSVDIDENGEITNLPLGITYDTSLSTIVELQFLLQINENNNYAVHFDTSKKHVIQVVIENSENGLVHELVYNAKTDDLQKIIITKQI